MKDKEKVSYDEYLELVKDAVMLRTGTRVELQKSTKNNGLVMDGLMIVSEGSNVAPMIYLNNTYEEFLEHGAQFGGMISLHKESLLVFSIGGGIRQKRLHKPIL